MRAETPAVDGAWTACCAGRKRGRAARTEVATGRRRCGFRLGGSACRLVAVGHPPQGIAGGKFVGTVGRRTVLDACAPTDSAEAVRAMAAQDRHHLHQIAPEHPK